MSDSFQDSKMEWSNLILISVSRQSSMKSTLYHLSSFEFDNVIGDNFISDCLIGSCQSGVRKERPGDISRGQSVPISSSENSIVRIGKWPHGYLILYLIFRSIKKFSLMVLYVHYRSPLTAQVHWIWLCKWYTGGNEIFKHNCSIHK